MSSRFSTLIIEIRNDLHILGTSGFPKDTLKEIRSKVKELAEYHDYFQAREIIQNLMAYIKLYFYADIESDERLRNIITRQLWDIIRIIQEVQDVIYMAEREAASTNFAKIFRSN